MGNFYLDVICQDPRFHSLQMCRDMNLLEPVTRAGVLAIIEDAKAEGIILEVSETYRSRELQEHDFAIGATQLKTVGVHHFGLAADFFKLVNGKASWSGDWTFLCRLAERNGLVSGGNWGCCAPRIRAGAFRDWDHVQRVTIEEQPKLFAGTWYPDSKGLPNLADVPALVLA